MVGWLHWLENRLNLVKLLPHLAPADQLDWPELSFSCQLGATSGIIITVPPTRLPVHPQQKFVSTQLWLWLIICCWGCGCCRAVTIIGTILPTRRPKKSFEGNAEYKLESTFTVGRITQKLKPAQFHWGCYWAEQWISFENTKNIYRM